MRLNITFKILLESSEVPMAWVSLCKHLHYIEFPPQLTTWIQALERLLPQRKNILESVFGLCCARNPGELLIALESKICTFHRKKCEISQVRRNRWQVTSTCQHLSAL